MIGCKRGLGLTDAEMELARALPSSHWADLGKELTEEFAADLPRRAAIAAGLVTALGPAEGWLPDHLVTSYDISPL